MSLQRDLPLIGLTAINETWAPMGTTVKQVLEGADVNMGGVPAAKHSRWSDLNDPLAMLHMPFEEGEDAQPPPNWPTDKDEEWKAKNSPLKWELTLEQKKRKREWFEYLLETEGITTSRAFIGSFIKANLVRRNWLIKDAPEQKTRIITGKDMHFFIHPNSACNKRIGDEITEETYSTVYAGKLRLSYWRM